jgi:hypothetical protein
LDFSIKISEAASNTKKMNLQKEYMKVGLVIGQKQLNYQA